MVGGSGEVRAQGGSYLFGGLAGLGVDDSRAGGGGGEEFAHKRGPLGAGGFYDLDVEVGAAEAGDEDGGVLQREGAEDILLYGGGGRGSEGDDG